MRYKSYFHINNMWWLKTIYHYIYLSEKSSTSRDLCVTCVLIKIFWSYYNTVVCSVYRLKLRCVKNMQLKVIVIWITFLDDSLSIFFSYLKCFHFSLSSNLHKSKIYIIIIFITQVTITGVQR